MTTTFDTDSNTATMAAAYFDDPDTYTIAEAWASSPLGELDDDIADEFTASGTEQPPRANSRAPLFAALAAGIIGGATVGAVLFGSIEPAKPTYVVPNSGVSTSPIPSSTVTPSSAAPPLPKPAAITQVQKPAKPAPASKPVAPAPEPAPSAPKAAVDPGTPPVSPPPVVVDISIPPMPPLPDPYPPAPEPPKPQPPKFDPPDIDGFQVPQVNPDPPKPQQVDVIAPNSSQFHPIDKP